MTEEQSINLKKVSPVYTSQTCSYCGVVDKKYRNGNTFYVQLVVQNLTQISMLQEMYYIEEFIDSLLQKSI